MRRVLYITDGVLYGTSAYRVNIMSTVKSLTLLGNHVDVYYRGSKENTGSIRQEFELSEMVTLNPIKRVGRGFIWIVSYLLIIMRRFSLSKNEYSEVLIRSSFDSLYGLVFALVNYKVIIERHNPPYLIPKISRICDKILFRFLSAKVTMVFITHRLAQLYMSYNWHDSKVLVLPDGAFPSQYFDAVRKQVTAVGYSGSLYEGRGMEVIVGLASRFPKLQFYVAGGNEEEVKIWKERIPQDSLNISFVGHLRHSEVPKFLSRMDILLAPYQRAVAVRGGGNTVEWMSPLKIFEYMAAGIPFICSDLPVLKEVLKDGYNSLLVAPNDIDSWELALNELTNSFDLRMRLSLGGLQDINTKYSWVKRTEKILYT